MAKTNATKPETNELRHFYFRHDRGRKELMYVLVSKRIQLKPCMLSLIFQLQNMANI